MTQPQIGHYRLESHIGSGGMGAVYRAVDTRLNRAVAIKLWHSDNDDPTSSARMLKEARAASALNHPNIVIIHEFGETADGDAFIVQEFIDGHTLRSKLVRAMPIADAIDVAVQVARALATAHAIGVIHRDIKPENVMLRVDGYVKVLDFGIAHLPDISPESAVVTDEMSARPLLGTPSYMSPEMVLGDEIGAPTDVFALGVMLYEMLSGELPFTAPSVTGVLASIATDEPEPLTSYDASIPAGLDAFVHSMLHKTPGRRPTAAEVERALPAFALAGDVDVIPRSEASALAVGRERQIALLNAQFARVRAGRSLFVGVSGEPGIGKSTLLDSFVAELHSAPERTTIVRSRCSENLAGSEAYAPVLEALDEMRTRSRSSFDTLMHSVAPTWHFMLGTLAGDEERRAAAAASQERMKRELRAFLADAARRAPVIWIIEDLHWADISTIDILNYVATRLDDARVLIIAAFRPTDMTLAKHPFLAVRSSLQSSGLYEEVALKFLARDDVKRYLSLRWPSNEFDDSLVDEIYSRTEGSPLFMADLVRYLHDTGAIIESDGTWKLAAAAGQVARELPESLRGMITAKIERVDEAQRKLLLAACVQGAEFDSGVVCEALGLDAADVEDGFASLQQVHRLVERGDEVEYPDSTVTLRYRFVHVLYQNVLYDSLQPSRRASLCSRAAQSLATHYASDAAPVAGRIALLFESAREFAPAGQYFYLAAQRAVSLFAFRECLALAERGLAGVNKLPVDATRLQLELGLQMMRGLAMRFVKGWAAPELAPTFARARQICADLNDPPALVPVMWNVALFNMLRGDLPLVRTQSDTLNEKALASGEQGFVMSAVHIDGVWNEFMGNIPRSMELLERARELHDPARHSELSAMFGMDPGMVARAMSCRTLWAAGFPDRALARATETIELSRAQRQPVTLIFALLIAEGIHLYRGEADAAIALGDQVEAMAIEYEFAQEREWGRSFQGAAYAMKGDVDRGVHLLEQSLIDQDRINAKLVRSMWLSLVAEAYWRAGKVEDGLRVIDEGFAYVESSKEGGYVHELYRIRGLLHERAGRLHEAEQALRAGLEYARARDAKSFELRSATALSRVLAATGRRDEARDVLGPALNWFTEGLGTADLVAARTLLTELG